MANSAIAGMAASLPIAGFEPRRGVASCSISRFDGLRAAEAELPDVSLLLGARHSRLPRAGPKTGIRAMLIPSVNALKREKDPKKRVVITGMGLVSVFGNKVDTYYEKLLEGQSGIAPIDRFDASKVSHKIWRTDSGIFI